MSFLDDIDNAFNQFVVDPVWTAAVIVMVVFSIIFFKKVGTAPFVLVKDAVKSLRSSIDSDGNNISTFGAFCNSLCTHIGTGNILGVALAIITGGFGSLFWMWIFALIAASLVFVECVIGQLFKEKMGDGLYRGGPAYFIRKGLKNHKLAIAYAILSMCLSIFACGVYVGNMNDTLDITFHITGVGAIVTGLIVTGFVTLIIVNKVTVITQVTSKLIPIFCLFWIFICVVSIAFNYTQIPWAFGEIFRSAFDIQAMIGAGFGCAIIIGFKRGAFCSDAGHGQISPVASEADNPHPCIQGFVQSFGLFFDIFVICTLSALLVMICGGVPQEGMTPAAYVLDSLKNGFLGDFAPYIFIFIMIMLGISSSTGNFLCAESNLHEITDTERGVNILRAVFIGVMIFSILVPVQMIFDIADFFTAILSFVNCIALYLLVRYVPPIIKDYKSKRKSAEEPKFDLTVLDGLEKDGITAWAEKPDVELSNDSPAPD